MRKIALMLATVSLAACKPAASDDAAAPGAPPAAKLSLTRLDCGRIHVEDFGSAFADAPGLYPKGPKDLTDSCYLIRHGDQLMVWDTGFSVALIGHPYVEPGQTANLDRSIVDQLQELGVGPDQINFVGISHYHADHTGQAQSFPGAGLLIGKADFDALRGKSTDAFFTMAQNDLSDWLSGEREVVAVEGDKDIFGDGSVVMLGLPGHTPGHHALLVNLKSGPVMLSGDLYHADIARQKRGVPPFNTDRAATLKSMDAFEAKAKQLKAKVIIQHELADVAKLPAFPKAAE